MALSAATDWEVRTAGAETNGGGYVRTAGTTDYSQTDTKRTATGTDDSTTDAVANGTTTITSATANFSAQLVGNIVYFAGGTGAITGVWRQVTARTNATTITIDASIAASTGMTMNIGGALQSLGQAGFSAVAGNIVYMKAGSYSISSSSANVSGGKFSKFGTDISVVGYTSSRGDFGATRPVLTVTGAISNFHVIDCGGSSITLVAHLEIDCGSKATMRGISINTGTVYKCKVSNATNSGIFQGEAYYCEVTGCATSGAAFNSQSAVWGCNAHDNTVPGFSACTRHLFCIADTNTGGSTDGFITTGSPVSFHNCVSYANGRDGFRCGAGQHVFVNNIAEANTSGTGFNAQNSSLMLWLNNAAYNNSTNFSLGTGKKAYKMNSVTGTGSFFTNAASGDFSLNNTASAGAAARAAGATGVFPGATTTGYLDIGAAQHADPVSGGSGGGAWVSFG